VTKEIAALPSGHVGVHRAAAGKGWEAYVMEEEQGLLLLGVFPTIRAAVAARAKYWQKRAA
jgi:hypothetical protein